MTIIYWHGYLLKGTGSNIFTSSMAREWVKQGHRVILVCQERSPEDYDFINAAYDFQPCNYAVCELFRRETAYRGECLLYRPQIGRMLPVYVEDQYPFFTAKSFLALTDGELGKYMQQNQLALQFLSRYYPNAQVVINHALPGPAIAWRTFGVTVPYMVVIHGSDLTYAAQNSERYRALGREGLAHAKQVFVAGEWLEQHTLKILGNDLTYKFKRLTPGVDTNLFEPGATSAADWSAMLAASEALLNAEGCGLPAQLKAETSLALSEASISAIEEWRKQREQQYDNRHPDCDLIMQLAGLQPGQDRIIAFVGKLIAEKGPQVLLIVLPLILSQNPRWKACFIGFGEDREYLEAMLAALQTGNRRLLEHSIALMEQRLEAKPAMQYWNSLSETAQEKYLQICKTVNWDTQLVFTGQLPHTVLSKLLPFIEVQVVPSILPESFGMVAVEGLAAGVKLIIANHSGLAETGSLAQINGIAVELLEPVPAEMAGELLDLLEMMMHCLPQSSVQRAAAWRFVDQYYSWAAIAVKLLHDDHETNIIGEQ